MICFWNPTLQQLANSLTESIEEHDKMLGENLRQVELLDKKKVCFFLRQWDKALGEEAEGMEGCLVRPAFLSLPSHNHTFC